MTICLWQQVTFIVENTLTLLLSVVTRPAALLLLLITFTKKDISLSQHQSRYHADDAGVVAFAQSCESITDPLATIATISDHSTISQIQMMEVQRRLWPQPIP